MRLAVISDIHGNLTAFEAVLADLRQTSPDLVFHGGDLAHGGSSPLEVVDRIRDLGWPGVLGNTDEMLFRPESLRAFASRSPQLQSLFAAIEEMGAVTAGRLGENRLDWLSKFPITQTHGSMALLHASPESTWRSPGHEASDDEMESAYAPLGKPIVVYGHIHRPFIRDVSGITVINSGSVSMSYDGDPRASYLLLDDSKPTIRRVAYDVDKEVRAVTQSGLPHSAWVVKILRSASPQML